MFGHPTDGYIGTLPQENRPCADWATFYAQRRLEPPLDLAEVHCRIQRIAAVVHDVHAQDSILAGERINDDLADSRAVGKIEERPATAGAAVVVDLRRPVEARRGQ